MQSGVKNSEFPHGEIKPVIFPNPAVKYKILSLMDRTMALDVTSVTNEGKDLEKGNLILWEYHGGPNQQYYIVPATGNKVRIYNAASGYPIKVPRGKKED